MLSKLEISGIHTTLDEDTKDYVKEKIGGLDRLMPKHARASAHAEVHLKKHKSRGNKFVCIVTLYLPHQTLTAHEAASSFESAIDSAEDKLKSQIHKYKDVQIGARRGRHLLRRLTRSSPESDQ